MKTYILRIKMGLEEIIIAIIVSYFIKEWILMFWSK